MRLFMLITLTMMHLAVAAYGAEPHVKPQLEKEAVLIDTLRQYIDTLQQKIDLLKRKTTKIAQVELKSDKDVAAYLNNPLNALQLLKRFNFDWPEIVTIAGNWNATDNIVAKSNVIHDHLLLPNETDYEAAIADLLRLQQFYDLTPQSLAAGIVNGIKLGSEMSWNDCMEIGQKSYENGDYTLAKLWLKTALEKLPVAVPNKTHEAVKKSEVERARVQILEALVSTEYDAGNLELALDAVFQLLVLRPKRKHLQMKKLQIEQLLAKKISGKIVKRKQKKRYKLTEEVLIEEICRTVTVTNHIHTGTGVGSNNKRALHCVQTHGNLQQLLLQPLRIEYLSIEPFIVLQHDALSTREIDELSQLLPDNADIDIEYDNNADIDASAHSYMKFMEKAAKKMQRIVHRLSLTTGHKNDEFESWHFAYTRSHAASPPTFHNVHQAANSSTQIVARAIVNLKNAKLGGAIVFPQLELSIDLPTRGLLYWRNYNEFNEEDYRCSQHVCPIISGTQISVQLAIKL